MTYIKDPFFNSFSIGENDLIHWNTWERLTLPIRLAVKVILTLFWARHVGQSLNEYSFWCPIVTDCALFMDRLMGRWADRHTPDNKLSRAESSLLS